GGGDDDGMGPAEHLAHHRLAAVPVAAEAPGQARLLGPAAQLVQRRPAAAQIELDVGAPGSGEAPGDLQQVEDTLVLLDAPREEDSERPARGGWLAGAVELPGPVRRQELDDPWPAPRADGPYLAGDVVRGAQNGERRAGEERAIQFQDEPAEAG